MIEHLFYNTQHKGASFMEDKRAAGALRDQAHKILEKLTGENIKNVLHFLAEILESSYS